MRFLVRVAMGVALGLGSAAGLSFALATWWVIGLVAALAAVVAFLGSFFVWSADRPEEGYEQVLFDRPNSLVSVGLVGFAMMAALGGAWLLAPAPPAVALDPAVETMDAEQDALDAAAAALLADADAYTKKELATEGFTQNLAAHHRALQGSTIAINSIDAPAEYAPMHAALKEQVSLLSAAVGAHERCLAEGLTRCVDAQLALAERSAARSAYLAAAAAAGV